MTDLIDPQRIAATTHCTAAARSRMRADFQSVNASVKQTDLSEVREALAEHGSLIDLALLAEITGGNVQTQAEIVAEFTRVNEVDAQRLRDSVRAGDYTRVVEFSHRIKGSGLMLGATLLTNTCGRLETSASSKDLGQVQAAMLGFEVEILRLNKFLDTLIRASGPRGRGDETQGPPEDPIHAVQ